MSLPFAEMKQSEAQSPRSGPEPDGSPLPSLGTWCTSLPQIPHLINKDNKPQSIFFKAAARDMRATFCKPSSNCKERHTCVGLLQLFYVSTTVHSQHLAQCLAQGKIR